ncbi:7-carboxy-7-deazaguanine synthase QueE [Amycolatopsis cihanbeyliensis]|uniref:7-carboxy-7-deazaguanine synthase QueE n=1 Tax=Amycolatopsis cihanbeyliensis TaxID=1128664 RepID=UPI001FEAF8B3|nr:7-carboxy-7-deazaguanine synthase QueE [Amycolatopsis cihanbeyliensis]
MRDALLITETFGPTFQGEGPSCGQPAIFIRTSRCNLTCDWCDEPRTWDHSRFNLAEHTSWQSIADLTDWVLSYDTDLVVITGGEPLLQQYRLVPLVAALLEAGRRVEFETNGTIVPVQDVRLDQVQFNVSPKLASSGIPAQRRIVPEALNALPQTNTVFKFVITAEHREADLAEADHLVDTYGLRRVWLMPEGTTRDAVTSGLQALAEPALKRGWGLTTRLHVQLWENAHGR